MASTEQASALNSNVSFLVVKVSYVSLTRLNGWIITHIMTHHRPQVFLFSKTQANRAHKGQVRTGRGAAAHRPAVDHQEGFGGGVEGAGRQRLRLSRNDVAQVIIGI